LSAAALPPLLPLLLPLLPLLPLLLLLLLPPLLLAPGVSARWE